MSPDWMAYLGQKPYSATRRDGMDEGSRTSGMRGGGGGWEAASQARGPVPRKPYWPAQQLTFGDCVSRDSVKAQQHGQEQRRPHDGLATWLPGTCRPQRAFKSCQNGCWSFWRGASGRRKPALLHLSPSILLQGTNARAWIPRQTWVACLRRDLRWAAAAGGGDEKNAAWLIWPMVTGRAAGGFESSWSCSFLSRSLKPKFAL